MPLAAAPRPIVPLWAAVLTSVVSGVMLTTAFPALSWWPMAFPAVVLALIGLVGRRVWSSVLVGFAFGAAFFFVNLIFPARYLGPVPWIALSMLEALLTAAGAVPITLAYRWLPRVLPGLVARLALLPLLVAGLWTLREQVVGSWPYGGFPWGRIGITQVNSPLADLASWVGVSGLTFLVVLLCAAAIEYVRAARFRRNRLAVDHLQLGRPVFLIDQHGGVTGDRHDLGGHRAQAVDPAGQDFLAGFQALLDAARGHVRSLLVFWVQAGWKSGFAA